MRVNEATLDELESLWGAIDGINREDGFWEEDVRAIEQLVQLLVLVVDGSMDAGKLAQILDREFEENP